MKKTKVKKVQTRRAIFQILNLKMNFTVKERKNEKEKRAVKQKVIKYRKEVLSNS